MLGLDILRSLREENLKSKIIMISAVGQQSVIDEGMRMGLNSYIVKPFTAEQLVQEAKNVLAQD
jgi:two-component system chemotaxis response regulator CheY